MTITYTPLYNVDDVERWARGFEQLMRNSRLE